MTTASGRPESQADWNGYYRLVTPEWEQNQHVGELLLDGARCTFRWGPTFRHRTAKGVVQGSWEFANEHVEFRFSAVLGIGPESRSARVRLADLNFTEIRRGRSSKTKIEYFENGQRTGLLRLELCPVKKPLFPE